MANWSIPLHELADTAINDLETTVRKGVFAVMTDIIKASPVDTGMFRSNWQLGVMGKPNSVIEEVRSESDVLDGIKPVLTEPLGTTWHFVNNLPYANRLEFGYSDQAPTGMVRNAVKNFENYLKKSAPK